MATKPKAKPLKTAGKKKQPSAVETSASIESKIESFLAAGGKIEKIASGVSGQQSMAQKSKPAAPAPAKTTAAE